MLDDELSRRFKDAALDAPGDLDMLSVRGRARSLLWMRRGVALGLAMVVLGAGGVIATRWPEQHDTRFSGPIPQTSTGLPRDWTLDSSSHGVVPRLSQGQAEAIATRRSPDSQGQVVRAAFGLFTDHNSFRVGTQALRWHNIAAWTVTLKGVPVCSYAIMSGRCPPGVAFVAIGDASGKIIEEQQRLAPPGDSASPSGPILGVYSPGNGFNTAAANGTLVLNNGCVMLQKGSYPPEMIAWLPGFHTESATHGVRVVDREGATVAAIGDRLQLGGGPISAHSVRTSEGRALPEGCVTHNIFAMYTLRRFTTAQSHLARPLRTGALESAISRLELRVDVSVPLPLSLPKGSELNSPRGVSFFREGGHVDGRLSLVFGSRKHVLIDYGVSRFDGCDPSRAEPVSVGGQPGLMLSSQNPEWTQVIWPATANHPQGQYGVAGSLSPAQALAIAESMGTGPPAVAAGSLVGC